MNETFYKLDEDFLAHHGILGMKWGKKNGPPYPLSDADHAKVIRKAEKKREKAEARKKKNAKTAVRLKKHKDEYTNEEILEALRRLDIESEIDKRLPEKKKKQKKLSAYKKMLARTPESLLKNRDRFTSEELALAISNLDAIQKIRDLKIRESRHPAELQAAKLATYKNFIDFLSNTATGVDKVKSSYESIVKLTGGMTPDERHEQWLDKHPEYARYAKQAKKNGGNKSDKDKILDLYGEDLVEEGLELLEKKKKK